MKVTSELVIISNITPDLVTMSKGDFYKQNNVTCTDVQYDISVFRVYKLH